MLEQSAHLSTLPVRGGVLEQEYSKCRYWSTLQIQLPIQ